MAYVMVPVPEEFVGDVMQHVVMLSAQADREEWTEASVAELFERIDEPSRALLSSVATGAMTSQPVSEVEVADSIQLTRRELVGIMREINESARDDNKPHLVSTRVVTQTLPNGRNQDVRLLVMQNELASLVQGVDREHLMASGDPFADTP